MTSNEQSLEGLLELVKAATGPDRELDRDIHAELDGWEKVWNEELEFFQLWKGERWIALGSIPAYTASIDAALALVERLLPGWRTSIYGNHMTAKKEEDGWRVQLLSPKKSKPDEFGFRWPKYRGDCLYAPTLPLAILAALFTALKDASE